MKLQGSGVFHPKTLQSQNCQRAENRLSLNGLEFVHGQQNSQPTVSIWGSRSPRASCKSDISDLLRGHSPRAKLASTPIAVNIANVPD